ERGGGGLSRAGVGPGQSRVGRRLDDGVDDGADQQPPPQPGGRDLAQLRADERGHAAPPSCVRSRNTFSRSLGSAASSWSSTPWVKARWPTWSVVQPSTRSRSSTLETVYGASASASSSGVGVRRSTAVGPASSEARDP